MRIRGKFHKNYLIRSISVRLSAAVLTAGIILTGAIFSKEAFSAKAAFFSTDNSVSFMTPCINRADFNQTYLRANSTDYPVKEKTLTTTKAGIYYYDTRIINQEITATRPSENIVFYDVPLEYDFGDEYVYAPTSILTGSLQCYDSLGNYKGLHSRTYSKEWQPTDLSCLYSREAPLPVTYSAIKTVSGAGFGSLEFPDEKLSVIYPDSSLYNDIECDITELNGYDNRFIWENSSTTLKYVKDIYTPLDEVSGIPELLNPTSELSSTNNILEYNTILDGNAHYVNNTIYECESAYFNKSVLDSHIISEDITKDNINTLKGDYALATFKLPYNTTATVHHDIYGYSKIDSPDEFPEADMYLFWNGEQFVVAGIINCGKVVNTINGTEYTSYKSSVLYKSNYDALTISPDSNDLIVSDEFVADYTSKTTSTPVIYKNIYNEANQNEFELTFSSDEKYYESTLEYYICSSTDNCSDKMLNYNPDYSNIIELDMSLEKIRLNDIENTRLINVLPGKKYKFIYDGIKNTTNAYIGAVIYEKSNPTIPSYYGRLCEIDSFEGEAALVIPENIISGEYILGIFTEIDNPENEYSKRMSSPAFAQMSIVGFDNGVAENNNTKEIVIEPGDGTLLNPMVAQDKYGIWWNYTTSKKYKLIYRQLSDEEAKEYEFNNKEPEVIDKELISEYIDRLWLAPGNTASIQALSIALSDEASSGMKHELVLPDTLTGDKLKVTAIGGGTSSTPVIPSDINDFNHIRLPGFCSKINDYAFYENDAHIKLDLTDTIEEIGAFSFGYNSNMSCITGVGDKLNISKYAFTKCTQLEHVYLDYSNTLSIGYRAFYGDNSIRQTPDEFAIYLSGASLTIDEDAFRNSMQSNMGAHIKIESEDGCIGSNAFKNSMNIPDNLYGFVIDLTGYKGKLSSYAFDGAKGIRRLYIPQTASLEPFSFANLENLSELEIDIAGIPENCFYNCPNISNVIFDNNVLNVSYNWSGDVYSGKTINNVAYYIENPEAKFSFKSDDQSFYSAFGVVNNSGVKSREITNLFLYYNTNTQGQTARLENNIVTQNLLGLNMSLGNFDNYYKANGAIRNINWVPADQFKSGDFGYSVYVEGLNYIPNVDVIKRPAFNTRPVDNDDVITDNKDDNSEIKDNNSEVKEESSDTKEDNSNIKEDSSTNKDNSQVSTPPEGNNNTNPTDDKLIEYNNKVNELNGIIAGLQTTISSLNSKVSGYEATINSLNSKIDKLELDSKNITYQPDPAIIEQNNKIKSELEQVKNDNIKLKADNVKVISDNEKIKSENIKIAEDNAKIIAENSKLESQNQKISELNDRLNTIVKDITVNKNTDKVNTVTGTISLPDNNSNLQNKVNNTSNNTTSNKPGNSIGTNTTTNTNTLNNSNSSGKMPASNINNSPDALNNVSNIPVYSNKDTANNDIKNILSSTSAGIETEENKNDDNKLNFDYYITEDGEVVFLDENEENSYSNLTPADMSFTTDNLSSDEALDSDLMASEDDDVPVVKIVLAAVLVIIGIAIFIFLNKKKKTSKIKK